MLLTTQTDAFYLPDNITYLNQAYMSPLAKLVEQAGLEGMTRTRTPYLFPADEFFAPVEKLRQAFARLIDCDTPGRVVLVPSVSYGMANVAQNIVCQPGDEIIVTEGQFPSNVLPWQTLSAMQSASIKTIPAPAQAEHRGKIWNERILEAIGPKTRLVALPQVHWADGTRFDLLAIRKRTQEVGALLVIDGTQSVGALPFSIAEIQPDALVCAGYKWLLGPYSTALAYYGPHFDRGRPIEENWVNRLESDRFEALQAYAPRYRPEAIRFEMGQRNSFILLPMMQAALDLVNEWQPARIQEYARGLWQTFAKDFAQLGFGLEAEAYRAAHLFGLRIPEAALRQKIANSLREAQVYVSWRGESLRISLHLYNRARDLVKLLEILNQYRQL
ncbi:MAG: aminotransferase class V-fold PLP-dependent enzyme [Microscillaceae bacterium]